MSDISAKVAPPAPDPANIPPGMVASRRWAWRLLLLAGVSLLVAGWGYAWRQPPHADAWRVAARFAPYSAQWWAYPVERNAHWRLAVIDGDLRAVRVASASGALWVAGSGGLILHSADGGRSWTQQHPAAPGATAASARPPEGGVLALLMSRAHAAKGPADADNPPDIAAQSVVQGPPPARLEIPEKKPPQRIAPPRAPAALRTEPAASPVQPPVLPNGANGGATTGRAPAAVDAHRVTLHAIEFADERTGWVVGESGVILASDDGGAHWRARDSGVYGALRGLYFTDARRGWVVGDDGVILATDDGGARWTRQASPARSALHAVHFIDAARGWAVGDDGTLLATDNGGSNWRRVDSPTTRGLRAITFANARHGWVVGEGGVVLVTEDAGATWRAQANGAAANLYAARAPDAATVWVAGASGTLLRLGAGGAAWSPSGSESPLNALDFADARRGWAVGDGGVLLHTRDGGASWQYQGIGARAWRTRADASPGDYARYPAPWTYLCMLLGVAAIVSAARPLARAPAAARAAGIAGVFVNDEPLDPEQRDHLGHDAVADGVANYLLNRNTAPSLTLAVTGSWGSGKSSIMRRLEHRLRQAGFYPAWFNAWHHQLEGRQLASMLNAIRRQAVPRWYTPRGVLVRATLYWQRGWFYRLVFFALLGVLLVAAMEAPWRGNPGAYLLNSLRAALTDTRPVVLTPASVRKLEQDGVLERDALAVVRDELLWSPDGDGPGACRDLTGRCRFDNLEQLIVTLETQLQRPAPPLAVGTGGGATLTDEERQALRDAVRHLGAGPGTLLGLLLGSLLLPLLLGKGLAIYGINYLDLFKRLLPERGRVEGKEAVGTIEHFRDEFCRLTQALDERLVLFIDDLDRCDCATVREVMELVNYLTSVGKSFIVLGMAMEHVLVCIPARDGATESGGYARQYLRKLINIEVPVPALDAERSRRMLESQAGDTTRPAATRPLRLWAGWLMSGVIATSVAVLVAQGWSWLYPRVEPRPIASAQTLPSDARVPAAGVAAPTGPSGDVPPVDVSDVGLRQPGMVPPSPAVPPALLAGGLALGCVGLWAWLTRARWLAWLGEQGWLRTLKVTLGGAERTRDSPAFAIALDVWHHVIIRGDPTPRGLKRFVNRVRFLAMLELAQPAEARIPEDLLVALAALHHAFARLPEDAAALATGADWAGAIDAGESEARARDIADAIRLSPSWPPSAEQWRRFRLMVEDMHVH